MSQRKTTSELQARIQQRYQDTAWLIYHQQHVRKPNTVLSSPQTRQAFVKAENTHDLEDICSQPGPIHDKVQSQICVII